MKQYFVVKKQLLSEMGVPQESNTLYQVCYGDPNGLYSVQKELDTFAEASDTVHRRKKEHEFHSALDEIKELKALVRSMANYLEPYAANEQHIPTLNTVNDLLRRASKALRN